MQYHITQNAKNQFLKEGDYITVTNISTTVGCNKKLILKFREPYVVKSFSPHDKYVH